jgi:hypothetical protein
LVRLFQSTTSAERAFLCRPRLDLSYWLGRRRLPTVQLPRQGFRPFACEPPPLLVRGAVAHLPHVLGAEEADRLVVDERVVDGDGDPRPAVARRGRGQIALGLVDYEASSPSRSRNQSVTFCSRTPTSPSS